MNIIQYLSSHTLLQLGYHFGGIDLFHITKIIDSLNKNKNKLTVDCDVNSPMIVKIEWTTVKTNKINNFLSFIYSIGGWGRVSSTSVSKALILIIWDLNKMLSTPIVDIISCQIGCICCSSGWTADYFFIFV